MNKKATEKLVLSAMFAALCCVATMIIKLPTPGTGGYIHLGDAFVILSGIVLGPVYGMAAAGIGSMLADILSGYSSYAIPTLIIKALAALCCALIFKALKSRFENKKAATLIKVVISGIPAALVVVLGYFAIESTFLRYGIGAAASIPMNLVQGIVGMVLAAIIAPAFKKVPFLNDLF